MLALAFPLPPSLILSCVTHTLSLSLSYFLPPTSIAICILMNLGAVSSRSVIPTSCFSLSSCFYILIFLCPPPADSPPLSACFSFSEEAHANSAWTEQHHFIKSSAKHVRRCLLEVVLAQVRALIPSLLHGQLQAGVVKQHGVLGMKGRALYLEDFTSLLLHYCGPLRSYVALCTVSMACLFELERSINKSAFL